MNCKKGDLAYTVSLENQNSESAKRNSGRLVEVLEFIGVYEFGCGAIRRNVWSCMPLGGPMLDPYLRSYSDVKIDDENLRPIRDTPGADESLSWLDVPSQTKVTA